MAGLPVMLGGVHEASILLVGVVVLAEAVTVGAAGGSSTSVTLMVTAMVSSAEVSAVPSAVLAVGYVDGDAVGSLGLVVQGRLDLDLAGGRVDVKSLALVPVSE